MRFPALALVVLWMVPFAAWADIHGAPVAESHDRPRTCLVLGGGGARGAAHIGVLKVLEREHVPIDCIVGTSMGAIVGGMYAAGYRASEIESILESIDWGDVLHDRTPRAQRSMRRKQDDLRRLHGVELGLKNGKIALPRGVIQGQRLELLLRRLLLPTWQVQDFDDLPIPFRAIATDIVTGDKVVFKQGDLAMAIRASMSVPGAFAPVRLDGRLLVDGGLVDNVPIDEARKLGADRLIVSRVGSPLADREHLDSPLAISEQATRLLMKRMVDAQIDSLGPQDMLITPALGTLGAQEFNRTAEASAIGLAAAESAVDAIRRYNVDDAAYAAIQQRHRLPRYDAPLIAFIEVLRDHTRTGDLVAQRLDDHTGKPLDIRALDQDLATAYGEGYYEQLQWQLTRDDSDTGLVIAPHDKGWGPGFLHASLRLSSDLDGNSDYQLAAELTKTGLNPRGGEARFGLGLGREDKLSAELFQPFGQSGRHALSLLAGYKAFDVPSWTSTGPEAAQLRYSRWGGGIGWRYTPSNRWEASVDVGWHRERTRLLIGNNSQWPASHTDVGDVSLAVRYDTLDSSAFPRHGQRLTVGYQRYLRLLGSDIDANVTHAAWDGAWTHGNHSLLTGLFFSSASDDGEQALATHRFLGGLGYLSGYQDRAIFAPQTALARAIYYRRIGHADSLMDMPVYLGGSLELGGYWRRRDQVDANGMIGAGSLFLGSETALGPILLGYGRAERGVDSFYLLIGPLLRDWLDR